jgi:hypothetical protein
VSSSRTLNEASQQRTGQAHSNGDNQREDSTASMSPADGAAACNAVDDSEDQHALPAFDEMFDVENFIKDAPESERPFLRALTQTQMFAFFITERWASHASGASEQALPEIRFFDECILAKQNRSMLRVKKHSTPFLDDTSGDIVGSFLAPPPDTSGLGTGIRYHYDRFPRLQDRFFTTPRFVKPLIEESPLQRIQITNMMRKVTNVLMVSTHTSRRDWQGTLNSVITVQAFYRGYRARREYRRARAVARWLANRLSLLVHTVNDRRQFVQQRAASVTLQAAMRAVLGPKRMEQACILL